MQFYVMAGSFNVYGSHSTLSLIPDFLLDGAGDFGPAISELSVSFHLPHAGQPPKMLQDRFDDFNARRRSMPKVVFRRARGQMAIDIASDLFDSKAWYQPRAASMLVFNGGVAETVAALELMSKRLTPKDDFDLAAFLEHCQKALTRLPATADEFAAVVEACEQRDAARRAAESPWDRLDIDWRDFHPDARTLLDDPFFWEHGNDFAPHGNDTGFDLLAAYRRWFRRDPAGDPVAFLQKLIRQWGYPPEPSSELDRAVMDRAAVALAFAELKLRTDCTPSVAALARAALQRQRQRALDAENGPDREERLKRLDLLEARLPGGG